VKAPPRREDGVPWRGRRPRGERGAVRSQAGRGRRTFRGSKALKTRIGLPVQRQEGNGRGDAVRLSGRGNP
jgi:hypothetical protein